MIHYAIFRQMDKLKFILLYILYCVIYSYRKCIYLSVLSFVYQTSIKILHWGMTNQFLLILDCEWSQCIGFIMIFFVCVCIRKKTTIFRCNNNSEFFNVVMVIGGFLKKIGFSQHISKKSTFQIKWEKNCYNFFVLKKKKLII